MCLQCFSKYTERIERKKNNSQNFESSSNDFEEVDFLILSPEEMKEKEIKEVKKNVVQKITAITGVRPYIWPNACVACGDNTNLNVHQYIHTTSEVIKRWPTWLTVLGFFVGFLFWKEKVKIVELPVYPALCNTCETKSRQIYYTRTLSLLVYWFFSIGMSIFLSMNFNMFFSLFFILSMLFFILSAVFTPFILIWYAISKYNPTKSFHKISYEKNKHHFKFKCDKFMDLFREANFNNI